MIRREHRKLCIGDLRDRILLQNRVIQEPDFGVTDFSESFVSTKEVWASIKTTAGKVIFDGVRTDIRISHEISIRYDSSVTTETWILFKGNRFDIVLVEDLEERREYLKLLCIDRGKKDKEASEA